MEKGKNKLNKMKDSVPEVQADPFRPRPCCNYLAQCGRAPGNGPHWAWPRPSTVTSWSPHISVPHLSHLSSLQVMYFSFSHLRLFFYKMGAAIFFFYLMELHFRICIAYFEEARMSIFKIKFSIQR